MYISTYIDINHIFKYVIKIRKDDRKEKAILYQFVESSQLFGIKLIQCSLQELLFMTTSLKKVFYMQPITIKRNIANNFYQLQ